MIKFSNFGTAVRFYRERQGIGLNEFARIIGISNTYWSDIERCHKVCTWNMLEYVTGYFYITEDEKIFMNCWLKNATNCLIA